MTLRVLIADDQELIRSGIKMILEATGDIEVVGEAADGSEAIVAVGRLRPDVALMDIRMPDIDGIEATRRIVQSGSVTKVMILTTFDQDEHVFDALAAGASAFLVKSAPASRLVEAIRLVAVGEALFSPTVTRRLVEHYIARPRPHDSVPPTLVDLTPRELEVLRLLADGRSNTEIGGALYLSEATVKSHVTRVLSKLGVRDRVQAVIVAYESGLVRAGSRRH